MEWLDVDLTNCPIARSLELVGQPWTLLVLRESYNGVRRFDDLQTHLGVSRPVLSRRLKELVAAGLLERRPYRNPGDRERHEYAPTPAAWDLYPVLVGLLQWSTRYLPDPDGAPLELRDRRTGEPVVAAVVPASAAQLQPWDVEVVPGPGLRLLAGQAKGSPTSR